MYVSTSKGEYLDTPETRKTFVEADAKRFRSPFLRSKQSTFHITCTIQTSCRGQLPACRAFIPQIENWCLVIKIRECDSCLSNTLLSFIQNSAPVLLQERRS